MKKRRYTVTGKVSEQRSAAINSRWGGRGASATVRVDKDAAEALKSVCERDRRSVASEAIRKGVAEYFSSSREEQV